MKVRYDGALEADGSLTFPDPSPKETQVHTLAQPIVSFLTSVRHPANSADYARVERLLVKTLTSLNKQTSTNFEVVVVANRPLDLAPALRRHTRQIVVAFPPPSDHRGPMTGRDAVLVDKGTKLAMALSCARGGHVMFVDADDYVNVNVTAFVEDHPDDPGWYVGDGFFYDHQDYRSSATDRFNEVCGTSLIVRRDILPQPAISDDASQQEILDAYGESTVLEKIGSHRHLAQDLSLVPLPFPGAMYSVSTGENHSGARLRRPGSPLSRSDAKHFGISLKYVMAARGKQVFKKIRAVARPHR